MKEKADSRELRAEGRKLTRSSHRKSTSSTAKVLTAAMIWLSVREERNMPMAMNTQPIRKKASRAA